MKWLLLLVVAVDGDITVNVLSGHETMAQCHVAGTKIHWEQRMPINQEMLCFPTDQEVK
jgi:hypothetical protein